MNAQWADQYMGYNPKETRIAESNPDRLCSGISISLLATRSSHICSHQ